MRYKRSLAVLIVLAMLAGNIAVGDGVVLAEGNNADSQQTVLQAAENDGDDTDGSVGTTDGITAGESGAEDNAEAENGERNTSDSSDGADPVDEGTDTGHISDDTDEVSVSQDSAMEDEDPDAAAREAVDWSVYDDIPDGAQEMPDDFEVENADIYMTPSGRRRYNGDTYPSKYMTQDLPDLRNQGSFGTCWAHSAMALAEINMLKKGVTYNAEDLSELQLAYFTYNKRADLVDPLGGTEGDENGLGLDQSKGLLDNGGNATIGGYVLSSWMGAVDETYVPYGEAATVESGWSSNKKALIDEAAYEHDRAHLKNIYLNQMPSRYNSFNEDYFAPVKKLIYDQGAVSMLYNSKSQFYNARYNSYYRSDDVSTSHVVTIVGWDDDFPKEHFNEEAPGNGAWLIRNSWDTGTYDDHQEYNGYFWMSYYDRSISNLATAYEFDLADNYDNNYLYDGGMNTTSSNCTKGASVFTAHASEQGETLKAVSFTTNSANVDYEISVYTGLGEEITDPESGTRKAFVTGRTTYQGYYTVPLNEYVELAEGEKFSVVVSLSGGYISQEKNNRQSNWLSTKTAAKEGQSYALLNGASEWIDYGYVNDANLRIRAFTDNGADTAVDGIELGGNIESDGMNLVKGQTQKVEVSVTPSGTSQRSLRWSSDNTSVAVVSDLGVVRGVGAGNCTVTVSAGNISKSFDVRVSDELTGLTIVGNKTLNYNNNGFRYSVRTTPVSANAAGDVVWDSSNTDVLEIDSDGRVTLKSVGDTTLTATLGGKTATKKVSVQLSAPDSLKVEMKRDYQVFLEWAKVGLAQRYDIYRSENTSIAVGKDTPIASISVNETDKYLKWWDKTLTEADDGKTYYYFATARANDWYAYKYKGVQIAKVSGGTVHSSIESEAEEVFGDDADVSYDDDSSTLTISMNKDMDLTEPIVFKENRTGDNVVIDLNGHSIKGAPGVSGSDYDKAAGGSAIEIRAARYNVEIKGPGMIAAGKSAVYENPDTGYRYGRSGSSAIWLTCGKKEYYPTNELEYALKISGGAEIKGGDGGDVDYDDWEHNFKTDVDEMTNGRFKVYAGNGGSGIGQKCTYGTTPEERQYNAYNEKVFLKYIIEDADISGGKGGSVYCGSHAFTNNFLRNNEAVKDFIQRSGRTYTYVFDLVAQNAGDGGDGIEFYWGRKYLHIGEGSTVTGGTGGRVVFDESAAMVKRTKSENGKGGAGIRVEGDIGLTNTSSGLSTENGNSDYWGNKTKDSEDVGLWIDGTVKGGNSADTYSREETSAYPGNGILMESDYYRTHAESPWYDYGWGIIAVGSEGTVSGGNAGNTAWGQAAPGATAIYESQSKPDAFCDHYIIRGNVNGGAGGYSICGEHNVNSTPEFTTSLAEIGAPGSGGNGFDFQNANRTGIIIAGNGNISAGSGGHTSRRGGEGAPDFYSQYYEPWYEADEKAVSRLPESCICDSNLTINNAKALYIDDMDAEGLSAAVDMDSFSWDWNAAKQRGEVTLSDTSGLSANVILPEGYDGRVYYDWRVVYTNTSTGQATHYVNHEGGYRYELDLGSAQSFTFGEAEIDLDSFIEYGALAGNNGGTTTTIYCYVMLDDGRYVKSNEISFCNDGEGYAGDPSKIKVTKISLDKSSITLSPEGKQQLTATVTPANAGNKEIEWSSYDETIATVDSEGLVTGVADGHTFIFARAVDGSGKSAFCEVTVKTIPITSIKLNASEVTLFVEDEDDKAELTAEINPAGAGRKIEWTSQDPAVATVSCNNDDPLKAVITAQAPGTTTIKATAKDGSNKSASCTVTVKKKVRVTLSANAGGDEVELDPDSITVIYGSAYGKPYVEGEGEINRDLPKPVRNDYIFRGWYDAVSGGNLITGKSKVENMEDHTLYAGWEGFTGWKKVDGVWYYYEDAKILKEQFVTVGGSTYYLKDDGTRAVGQTEIQITDQTDTHTEKYYFNRKGVMQTGWVSDGNGKHYYDPANGGAMAHGTWIGEGKNRVYVDDNGDRHVAGSASVNGAEYYFDSNGQVKTGWIKVSDKWYYFNPGGDNYGAKIKADAGLGAKQYIIGGKTYLVDEDGARLTGWQDEYAYEHTTVSGNGETVAETVTGYHKYYDTNGVMVTGWKKIGSDWYYFYPAAEDGENGHETGDKATGLVVVDGKLYSFGDDGKRASGGETVSVTTKGSDGQTTVTETKTNRSGVVKTDKEGFISTSSGDVYVASGGKAVTDAWVNVGDTQVRVGSDGKVQTGRAKVDGKVYEFDADGKVSLILPTGWVTEGDKSYYYDENGVQQKDKVVQIGKKLYSFDSNGALLTDGFYEKKSDGSIVRMEIPEPSKVTYIVKPDGTLMTGWYKDEATGNSYYFSADNGAKLTGAHKIGTERYYFDTVSGGSVRSEGWIDEAGEGENGYHRYYVSSNGILQTGWLKFENAAGEVTAQYYLGKDGVRRDDVIKAGTKLYYQTAEGIVNAENAGNLGGEVIAQTNGKAVIKMRQNGKDVYIAVNNKGVIQTGWQTIDGGKYYIDKVTGYALTGIQQVKGIWYDFGDDGKVSR